MTKKLRYFCTLLLMAVASVACAEDLTAEATVDELMETYKWDIFNNNSTCYTSFKLDDNITISTTGEANCGGIFGSATHDWRLYQNRGGNVIVSAADGYELKSVKFTFTVNSNGTLIDSNNKAISSAASTKVSGKSVTFTVGGSGTSGQIRITAFEVVYVPEGTPSLQDCDLTFGNTTGLTFDLYNDKDEKVINYTTSSTGDVSVLESNYATFVVDKENKKITVTPTKVTSGEQTIVVNQAADNNYEAGSATFKLTITDSTPFESGDMTFDATKDKDANNTSQGSGSIVKDPVTLACTDGILGNGSEYRLYKNSSTTISTTKGRITKIVFSGLNNSYPLSNLSTTTGEFSSSTGTWTGDATSVVFTASAQARAKKIVVTITPETTDPAINADNVSVGYDDTSGAIAYTIDNAVAGEALNAEVTTGDWLTLGTVAEGSVPFTCTQNTAYEARTATVTLTYASATKEITITQAAAPVVYDDIADMFAAATSTETDVLVKFGGWVVTGVSTNGKSVFVSDGTNGFIIFGESLGFEVGNTLTSSTPISCKLQLFNGSAEITALNASTDGLTVGTGGSVAVAEITMANLKGVNTGALVSYKELTCSVEVNNNKTNYYLSDGTTSLQVYNTLYAFGSLEAGKTYNITGVYQQYSTKNGETKEILPRSAADIEIVSSISTGINNVEQIAEGAAIYNLNGVRVNKMQKGVYVVNGKKVVIK